MKIVDIHNISLPNQEVDGDTIKSDSSEIEKLPDLTTYAYSEICRCRNETFISPKSVPERIVLLCRPNCLRKDDEKCFIDGALNEHYCGVLRMKKRQQKPIKVVNRRKHHRFYMCFQVMKENRIAPHTAITICQHFAYHGRLMRAIQLAFNDSLEAEKIATVKS